MWRLRAIPLVTTQSSTLVTAVAFASGGKSVKQVKKKKKKEEKVIPNKRRTVKEEPKLNSSTTPNNSKSGAVHSDMAERDTRLAVRLLMARHFSREYTNHRPEDIKLAEHRQAFREKHEDRLQRLEEKTNNSLKLLGRDGDAFGEGILPVFSSPTAAREKKRADGWRTVNPVSDPTAMDDGEVEEDWGASFNTLESLQKPNLSVYDSQHDIRRSSKSVDDGDGRGGHSSGVGRILLQELNSEDCDPELAIAAYSTPEDEKE